MFNFFCKILQHPKINPGSAPAVKEEDVARLERNDARMVRWICKVRPDDRISAIELRIRLKLKSIRKCLLDKRLQ